MLYTLLYLSKANKAFDQQELSKLLEQSRNWNEAHSLTGFLAYITGTVANATTSQFIQVLEGEQSDVINVFASILNDDRHTEIKVIKQGPISKRKFGLWKMGFQGFDIHESIELQQFFSMDATILAEDGDPDHNMLMSFMKSFYETGD